MSGAGKIYNVCDKLNGQSGIARFAELCTEVINSEANEDAAVSIDRAGVLRVPSHCNVIVHVAANDARVAESIAELREKNCRIVLLWHDPPVLGNNATSWLEALGRSSGLRALRRPLTRLYTKRWFRIHCDRLLAVVVMNRLAVPVARRVSGHPRVVLWHHPQYTPALATNGHRGVIYDLILFGNIAPSKGIIELAQMLRNCRRLPRTIRVGIAGGVPKGQKNYFERCRSAFGDCCHLEVNWLGRISDEGVASLFRGGALLVLPYRNGRFISASGPLAWARSFGVPVVVRRGSYLEGAIDAGNGEWSISLDKTDEWEGLLHTVVSAPESLKRRLVAPGCWRQFARDVHHVFAAHGSRNEEDR